MATDSKDIGWEFLNSNSSSSFNGSDGSYGFKHSDGSASYQGADGSYGHRNSDGSITYQGADGSYGYRNADGSGKYYSPNNDIIEYSTNDISDSGNLLASMIVLGIDNFFARREARRLAEEQELREKQRRKREFYRRHWKSLLFLIICIIGIVAYGIWRESTKIAVGYFNSDFLGKNYESVIVLLQERGYTNIVAEEIQDLPITEIRNENKVYEITISGEEKFNKTSRFPFNSEIIIKYHAIKNIPVPASSKELKGLNYQQVVEMFQNAGFINVKTEIVYDLITGWLISDGEVDKVLIDGEKRFDSNALFRPDEEIMITYHTYRKSSLEG